MPKQDEVLAPVQTPKVISGISVIFDWGLGADSTRGETAGHYSQSDVVDGYGRRMLEELDSERVRLHPIDTRKKPEKNLTLRFNEVPGGFLPVFLSCDWYENPRIINYSVVEYQGARYHKMADALCFALSEWGRCYVWGHRVSRPMLVADGEKDFIRIKPFALNGPHADEYLKRLDSLGEALGRAIGGYLLMIGQGRTKAQTR